MVEQADTPQSPCRPAGRQASGSAGFWPRRGRTPDVTPLDSAAGLICLVLGSAIAALAVPLLHSTLG